MTIREYLVRLPIHFVVAGLAILCGGCGEPIYQSVVYQPSAIDLTWPETKDESRYSWPLKGRKYIVTKPPPLAYLTSFSEKISIVDAHSQELVSWDDLDLEDAAKRFLKEAYAPLPTELTAVATLDADVLASDQAFDISLDGSRLVLLQKDQLVLYDCAKGTRIGKMQLPGDWSSSLPHAVRFCGRKKDFLVASEHQICRVSGKNGQVSAQTDGCRSKLVRWQINPDDSSMAILTEEGKLYCGDPQLKYFSPIDANEDRIDDIGLSGDATRIAQVSAGTPSTYVLADNRVLSEAPLNGAEFVGPVSIVAGFSTDGWMDGNQLVFRTRREDGEGGQKWSAAKQVMYWRPWLGVSCSADDRTNWFLTVGQRIIDDQSQWVLFDYGPQSHNFSVPLPLSEKPRRLVASATGEHIAYLDSQGLHLASRPVYASDNRIFLSDRGYSVVNTNEPEQIELLYEAIGRQKRWSGGQPPSQVQTLLLSRASYRWNYLERLGDDATESDLVTLRKLEAWYESGSILAKTVAGFRYKDIAWSARGTGLAGTVSQSGWKTFEEYLEKSIDVLKEVMESESPPALAFETMVQVSLDSEANLIEIDPLVRRCVELYPGNLEIATTIGFKLLPQWHGEPGDLASLIAAHANLYDGGHSDLVYAILIGRLTPFLSHDAPAEWVSIDAKRIVSGFREMDRLGWPHSDVQWNAKAIVTQFGNAKDNETVVRYMMKTRPTFPETGRRTYWFTRDVLDFPDRVFNEVLTRERKREGP